MEIKNRKLFPTGSEPNQTADCSDFCYPSCPYDCYSFPDFYFPPPPPPPPLSTANHSHPFSPLIIILISLFVSLFILLSYYILIIKLSCVGWCSNSRGRGPSSSQSDGGDEEFIDENRIDHPIWLISTVGLNQSVINSITICKYKKGEGLIEGSECSVCLSEFEEGEMLRLLPKCSHAFHIHCVDTWLMSHTNCPLCRSHIVVNDLVSGNREDADLRINEETQMENNGELVVDENQVVENEEEIKEGVESVDSNGQNQVLFLGNQEQSLIMVSTSGNLER